MFNDTPDANSDLVVFASICAEATARHGDDWPAVERHIKERVDALPLEQRERLAGEVARVLGFRAPDAGSKTQ